MTHHAAYWVVLSLAVHGAVSVNTPRHKPCVARSPLNAQGYPLHLQPRDVQVATGAVYRSYVLGDFGVDVRGNVPPGEWREDFNVTMRNAIAAAMEGRTASYPADSVLNVGDSFYSDGLQNTTDARWNTTFEMAFPEPSDAYWYSVLGNHDWYGNYYQDDSGSWVSDSSGVQAQIRYTTENAYGRWCMPDMNYTFAVSFGNGIQEVDGEVRYIFIDTQSMRPDTDKGCRNDSNWAVPTKRSSAVYCKGEVVYATQAQLDWIESVACQKLAPENEGKKMRTVVVGHHPLVTAGTRLRGSSPLVTAEWVSNAVAQYLNKTGDPAKAEALRKVLLDDFIYDETEEFRDDVMQRILMPVFERCGVDAYVSGHEHMTMIASYEYNASVKGTTHLRQMLFGDSGKSNLAETLTQEPSKTACQLTGQCFANSTYFAEVWGAGWSLHFKDHTGAFGDLAVTPTAIDVAAVGPNGELKFAETYSSAPEESKASYPATFILIGGVGLALCVVVVCTILGCRDKGDGDDEPCEELDALN
eukprot:TRINITY_DN38108_c0_g1_i1.p1 TRINITY_DN38108_c0_g1~~TRINITY_DN38108_c0_g1_i1.p1  ORF type:complete len:528 (+),score=192.71 TRINITY_DN38108_c0_g1_i1:33-1616(+)